MMVYVKKSFFQGPTGIPGTFIDEYHSLLSKMLILDGKSTVKASDQIENHKPIGNLNLPSETQDNQHLSCPSAMQPSSNTPLARVILQNRDPREKLPDESYQSRPQQNHKSYILF
ncbi:hypothetical protein AVEN_268918-1 [Araneus ventricosus]|uniref:Uncharacterized protein n=1 Tax=Araneus ventricosus TaxID=182803 RepID=A0A4Y2T2V5_ARAVE|nr:hypothetical protein AVEN_268918-1 [Araneus ventricosus]